MNGPENEPSEPADALDDEGRARAAAIAAGRRMGKPDATSELAEALARAPVDVRTEYEAARKELATLGLAFQAIATASSEQDALTVARAARDRLARIAVRWARARRAVAGSVLR